MLAVVAGGCGFHMPGEMTVPENMERTYIDAVDHFSQFSRELERQLLLAGVNIVESEEEATATISILFDKTDQRVLSVSARNVPTEFEVFYTVQYTITSGGKSLLETQELTQTRDYTYDATLVLGKAQEEQVLRDDIVQNLVAVVLKQISIL